MTEPELCAPIDDLGARDALGSWRWLVGSNAEPRLLTAMGDLFIVSASKVFLLDTYAGEMLKIVDDWSTFKARTANPDEEVSIWFKYDLLHELLDQGMFLSLGQCFSPIVPPVIGGKYEPGNFMPTPWLAHVSGMGQVHQQVRNLPPGTKIAGINIEWLRGAPEPGASRSSTLRS